jgi:hypothetical protein
MEKLNLSKISKIYLISLLSFDITLFLYIFVIGRSNGGVPFSEVLYTLTFLLMGISALISIIGIFYALSKEQYKNVLKFVGVFGLSILLFMELFIISLIYYWVI